jgi:hypothetical protein
MTLPNDCPGCRAYDRKFNSYEGTPFEWWWEAANRTVKDADLFPCFAKHMSEAHPEVYAFLLCGGRLDAPHND